ncbi:polysaccharide biosynthesis protein [Desulfonatronum thiodismutans]|uniref:polysaccharide biosynthesis protein n=1 Tax=Desulfonatronum thiodismutans TaxID=159290 RepID=UPI000A00689E|nr:nucleoside-diphosphate sugar epimerase/dehydratase [Desulfonatronum thiodismutans]
MFHQFKNPKLYVMFLTDGLLFALAMVLSYLIRFDFHVDDLYQAQMIHLVMIALPLKLVVFTVFGLYRGMWRYTGLGDLWHVVQAALISSLLLVALMFTWNRLEGYPRTVFVLDAAFTMLFAGGLRMVIRSGYTMQGSIRNFPWCVPLRRTPKGKRVLILGAGDAGEKILREIQENPDLDHHVLGFLDDDPGKRGRTLHGVPVLEEISMLPYVVEKLVPDELLIALPSVSGTRMRSIVELCKQVGIPFKTLPVIGEIIDGKVSVRSLREVNFQDLLGRPAVILDNEGIRGILADRTILVTGCGGSIGSELCRQIIRYAPRRLILLDSGETNLYAIQMELEHEHRFTAYVPVLGQVQDEALMEDVFTAYAPEVVFHAAAYKHVPMLENNPWQAVSTNIVGSKVVMEKSLAHGVQRFVLVSTDKAVRPTNVMGASKRVAELLLRGIQNGRTRFMAVRFGNVVGSSGSVIPLFRRQIELGGPVTVTHPEMIRYFMTIPESVQLILQSATLGKGGEIFVLDMGTPVRILDMARDLIRLSGKVPDVDIPIVITGPREGEKLFEELITETEGVDSTSHEKIMVLREDGQNGETEDWNVRLAALYGLLGQLQEAAGRHDAVAIKDILGRVVPEYKAQCGHPLFVSTDVEEKAALESVMESAGGNPTESLKERA